ncbi:hypothetical protein AAFP30_23835 [Gordonia sp. CPCC 205515]|uniref:hypothetical protein n=1 Tax=Gordonia sp. CPCC 205515 TaxID=3140791 RepID=UPI003AF3AA25
MAHHRSDDGRNGIRHRGVSRGLVAAVLSIVLIAAAVVVWRQLGDHIDEQGDQAAGTCVAGKTTVPVIADPAVAQTLGSIAQDYAKTNPIVRDHCITIAVRPGDARVTLDGLKGNWDVESLGPYPAAWVPESSIWAAELSTAKPDAVEGQPSSLVTSPVVLAMAPELAQSFDGSLDWSQVPMYQAENRSLARVGRGSWGSLRMAVPVGAGSDATVLAGQAVAAQVTRTSGTLTAADAKSPTVSSSIEAMMSGAPASPDGTTQGAANTMAENYQDPASSSIHAVPITEQSLYQLTRTDTTARLAEVVPGGPTSVADYPIIRLGGTAVPPEQSDAVAEFFDFVSKPEQLGKLTALGFRGDAPMPKPTVTVTFPVTPNPMPNPEPAAAVTINQLVWSQAGN